MSREPLRVSIVYPHLPHYRFGVFQSLAADDRISVTFIADEVERTGTIETTPSSGFSSQRVTNKFIAGMLWQRGLARSLWRARPQAVIFLGDASYLSTWVYSAVLRVMGVPVLYWTIGWHRPESGLKRRVRVGFYRLADTLLLYGHGAVEIGAALGYPRARMIRIGNSRTSSLASTPISSDRRRAIEGQLADLAPNVVVAVVRLNASKCLDLLVEAAATLVASGHSTTLLFVGEGPEAASLRAAASEASVDARFLGAMYSEAELQLVYAAADVTVLPSAAGLTVIQSLEHGVPVITHDNPHAQMPESEAVLPGVTGDLYREGDSADLARRMSSWFGGRARSQVVRAACLQEVADNWSPESQAAAITEALLSAANQGRRSTSKDRVGR
jgi:glycosyltransferase involved in cell wall biosynthesis